ncbi:MAG TPA: ferrichrome ABC transporter substrate-binding protein, partial [Enterococcus sp.]|nr:ferrichrome ABC transporter substrate-binding protein [Enterococcus sp.]
MLLAGVLSACPPSSDKETATPTNSTTSSTSTHTVTDTLGHKVDIPNAPKRIIGSYLEDYLISLGENPIDQWTVG